MYRTLLNTLLIYLLFQPMVIADNKVTLRIATENYPPYEMEEPINGLPGFDYEVMVEIFTALKYDLNIEFLPWKRALSYTKLGQVLGILTCAHSEEREAYMIFSEPLSTRTTGFYTRAGFQGPKPLSFEDLKGQKVGSVSAYASFKVLSDAGLDPIGAKDTEASIKMLKAERFDYLFLNRQSTDFTAGQLGLKDTLMFYPTYTKDFYFCFSRNYKGVDKFVKEFNQGLTAIKKNGTYKKIHDKYR